MSDLDQLALASWLQDNLPDFERMESLAKFPGGQSNPTYRIDGPSGSFVLRRKPFGHLLPSAHAIDREFRLLSALHPTGFPVPRPIALCDDAGVIGVPFYVMEMVEGHCFSDGTLPEVDKAHRRAHYEQMIDVLAELHSIDHEKAGLSDFGKSGDYLTRQVARWTKQYRAAQTDHIEAMERLMEWLPVAVPTQTGVSIIHGDYRIDNLIFHSGKAQVRAVIDWELATIGEPLADFTYFAMNWVMPQDGRSGLAGACLDEQGLMSLEDAVARYCAKTGRDKMPDLHWYFAYNLFRLAGILQGVKKRLADGNASSADAATMVAKIEPLALTAWHEARQAGAPN